MPILSVPPPPFVSAFTSSSTVARLSSVILAVVRSFPAPIASSTTLALSVIVASSMFAPALISFVPVPVRSMSVTLLFTSTVPDVDLMSTFEPSITLVLTF